MKRILAMAVTVVMMFGILSGCYNDYRLKEFNIDVGDEITFGTYQDEEIEWEVLARHFIPEEGTVRVRLLSKYALDCKPFNEDGESSWEDSSLREWLNNDFYNEAFSSKEQKQIVDTTYYNYTGDVRFLTDKVYLISHLWYRLRPEDAVCKASDYAEDQDISVSEGHCMYWCRDVLNSTIASVGETVTNAVYPAVINPYGSVMPPNPKEVDGFFESEDIGVRPIINVEYKAPYTMKDLEAGDLVTFGKYDEAPIEWVVADRDKKGVTLFSRYGLDDRCMNMTNTDEFEDTELYDWLNGEFKEGSFSRKEMKYLVEFDSDEYVTLLDKDEMLEYGREIKYELFTGYTASYYEENGIDEKNFIDSFWLKEIQEENDPPFMVFNIVNMGSRAPGDEEYSVRPVIKIKF